MTPSVLLSLRYSKPAPLLGEPFSASHEGVRVSGGHLWAAAPSTASGPPSPFAFGKGTAIPTEGAR